MALNRAEKEMFVDNLVGSVAAELRTLIIDGKVPDHWDGHELRQWLADAFAKEVCRDVMKTTRLRRYRIDVYNL